MANQALHVDRKGRWLIACCPFCVSGSCWIVCIPLRQLSLIVEFLKLDLGSSNVNHKKQKCEETESKS